MSEEQWTTIGKQLDDLSDLFRRRLLDDRAARDARQFFWRSESPSSIRAQCR